jgi:hypothetical protein
LKKWLLSFFFPLVDLAPDGLLVLAFFASFAWSAYDDNKVESLVIWGGASAKLMVWARGNDGACSPNSIVFPSFKPVGLLKKSRVNLELYHFRDVRVDYDDFLTLPSVITALPCTVQSPRTLTVLGVDASIVYQHTLSQSKWLRWCNQA